MTHLRGEPPGTRSGPGITGPVWRVRVVMRDNSRWAPVIVAPDSDAAADKAMAIELRPQRRAYESYRSGLPQRVERVEPLGHAVVGVVTYPPASLLAPQAVFRP